MSICNEHFLFRNNRNIYDRRTQLVWFHFDKKNASILITNLFLIYSACFVICYIPDKKSLPRYVSVVSSSSKTASASNILRIQYPVEKVDQLVDFSVCVKPIHFNYDNILPFLEWIEFHKLMGVTRFTFYNHTIGSNVGCVMREYGDEVDIEVSL